MLRLRQGYSLIELSIVLLIVSTVIAMGMSAGTAYIDRTKADLTKNTLARIQTAVEAYRDKNGFYPCPARGDVLPGSATFGVAIADCSAASVTGLTNYTGNTVKGGVVPVRSLGLTDNDAADGYDTKIYYVVTRALASSTTYEANNGTVQMYDGAGNSIISPDTTGHAAYAVISFGKDKIGTAPFQSTTIIPPAVASPTATQCGTANTTQNYRENCDTFDTSFVDGLFNDNTSDLNVYFDDFIVWGMKPTVTGPNAATPPTLLYSNDAGAGGFTETTKITAAVNAGRNVYIVCRGNGFNGVAGNNYITSRWAAHLRYVNATTVSWSADIISSGTSSIDLFGFDCSLNAQGSVPANRCTATTGENNGEQPSACVSGWRIYAQ